MNAQMNLRLDEKLKEQFQKLARQEGKSASEKLRELISDYIRERDISRYADDLWDRMEAEFSREGLGEEDIRKAINRVRRE